MARPPDLPSGQVQVPGTRMEDKVKEGLLGVVAVALLIFLFFWLLIKVVSR